MIERRTAKVERSDLHSHPAIMAWNKLQSIPFEPDRIEILKGKSISPPKQIKRLVCRLIDLDSARATIIGKRCRRVNAIIENTIYEDVVPYLKIPFLKYYGMVEEADGEFCWIFMEDAGGELYSELSMEQRKLAAQWLGTLHISARETKVQTCLPDRGPEHYLARLKSSRDAVLFHIDNNVNGNDNFRLFDTVVSYLNILEKCWDRVEEFCDGEPQTLVHGDFVAKNIRVRNNSYGMTLLPFDWGEAGWGITAIDLRDIEYNEYWRTVHNCWPRLNIPLLRKLSKLGNVFHYIDAIHWEIPGLKHPWWKDTVSNWRIYLSRLANGMLIAGLRNCS